MKKYSIIYADPPWHYGRKSYQDNGRDMLYLDDTQYKTMNIEEIKALPIKNIAAKDCACFMWCTDSHLKLGIDVLDAWGFKYRTIAFNWIKTYKNGTYCVNVAPYTLKSWEICLLGVKGSMGKHKKVSNKVQGLIIAPRIAHSKKPDIIRDKIVELYGDLPRIELFARKRTEGWDVWGDEVESDIKILQEIE